MDTLCRYDHRLFAVVMPHTAEEEAVEVSARVRDLLSSYTFRFQDALRTVRASFGVASYQAGDPETTEVLIKKALLALPTAVSQGKKVENWLITLIKGLMSGTKVGYGINYASK